MDPCDDNLILISQDEILASKDQQTTKSKESSSELQSNEQKRAEKLKMIDNRTKLARSLASKMAKSM